MGHHLRRPRHPELAAWTPQPEVRWKLSLVHLADVGILPEPRVLSVHEWLLHANREQRWDRFRSGELPSRASRRAAETSGYSKHGSAAVVDGRLHAGHVAYH